jgi:eukaryotic-like serine/threonine-protein kinase
MSEWDRIQSIFLRAVDRPPEERSAFLDGVCEGDLGIRREVESLLAHDDSANDAQIADALQDTTQSLLDFEEDIGPLGPWRVIKAIGRGGMGRVYLAARDDDQFRKLVAVKLVKRGMDTSELLDRFRRERQILAQLDHPYISRLIDGGSTSQGQPFLAWSMSRAVRSTLTATRRD